MSDTMTLQGVAQQVVSIPIVHHHALTNDSAMVSDMDPNWSVHDPLGLTSTDLDIQLYTLAHLIHTFAQAMLIARLYSTRSLYGLSIDTQLGFLLANLSRCAWVYADTQTRLKDAMMSQLELLLSTVVSCMCVYLCVRLYDGCETSKQHTLLRVQMLAPVACVLAFFFHPTSEWWSIQILPAFSVYLEALSLIPQLWLMSKLHFVEAITGNYLVVLVVARFVRMVFWGYLFFGLEEHFGQLLLADLLHSLLAADFLVLWVRKLSRGGELVYHL